MDPIQVTVTHDVYFHFPLVAKLESIANQLASLNRKENQTMAALDDLTTEVQENTDVTNSAITLIGGLKAKLDEAIASGNMASVKALSDQLSAKTDELAAAVAANTPAEEPPPE